MSQHFCSALEDVSDFECSWLTHFILQCLLFVTSLLCAFVCECVCMCDAQPCCRPAAFRTAIKRESGKQWEQCNRVTTFSIKSTAHTVRRSVYTAMCPPGIIHTTQEVGVSCACCSFKSHLSCEIKCGTMTHQQLSKELTEPQAETA